MITAFHDNTPEDFLESSGCSGFNAICWIYTFNISRWFDKIAILLVSSQYWYNDSVELVTTVTEGSIERDPEHVLHQLPASGDFGNPVKKYSKAF